LPTRSLSRSDPGHRPYPGEKGCTPIVRRAGSRFSVNAMAAISARGRMHFMVFSDTFDAEVMCRFLDRFARHFDHKVPELIGFLLVEQV
jgi:hypothetical protein